MAPSNGQAKARKGSGPARVLAKPVIPLPLDKKRAAPVPAAPAPAPRTQTNGTAPAVLNGNAEPKQDLSKTADSPKVVEIETVQVNGVSGSAPAVADVVIYDSPVEPVDLQPVQSAPVDALSPEPTPTQTSSTLHLASPPTGRFSHQLGPSTGPLSPDVPQVKDETPTGPLISRQVPPPISPTRYQMPPPFQPARMHVAPIQVDPRMPRPRILNGPPHVHHPHPSNGSLQFGGLHDSTNSSPAPPLSGGIGPPPGVPMDGRLPFRAHGPANGFPPPMPYGTEFVPVSDAYGRPIIAMTPMEAAYPPFVHNFGPSTPHSFHGSQSSAPVEDAGHPFPAGAGPNGSAAHSEEARPHPGAGRGFPPPGHARMMHNPGPPPHMMHPMAESNASDGLTGYLQSQFANATFSDCTLELRYADDRAAPVRIPGHRVILARSQTLQALLESNTPESSPHGLQRTLLLQSDDRYLRSDAFWMAVQRLYGLPLLEIPPELPHMSESPEITLAGSLNDRFEFALGYAAAGHLLRWESVVVRGIEIATQLLSWSTIERALEFALGDMAGRATVDGHAHFTYGQPVQFLLNGIISFLINNFPSNFTLDTSVADGDKYARLPVVPMPPATGPKRNAPTIVRGTSVHLGPGRRPRFSHIKFGDLSPAVPVPDGNFGPPTEAPKAPTQLPPPWHSILSRVLLNLPFAALKPALESGGHGNVSAWANAESRHRVIRDVVLEREARRLRAVDAVKDGRVAGAVEIQHRLSNLDPRSGNDWDALGWQEEVVPFGNADAPALVQKWIPLMATENGLGQGPLPTLRSTEFP